jgi:hypothetical protein
MVEVMGIEPTASSMRPKRSSQLSYTPEGTDTLPGRRAGTNDAVVQRAAVDRARTGVVTTLAWGAR